MYGLHVRLSPVCVYVCLRHNSLLRARRLIRRRRRQICVDTVQRVTSPTDADAVRLTAGQTPDCQSVIDH